MEKHPKIKSLKIDKLSQEEKNGVVKSIDNILDSLDDIQHLIGLEEYTKQLVHWVSIKTAVNLKY